MRLDFDPSLAERYHGGTQITRVLSEAWCEREMYCVSCDAPQLLRAPNNSRGIDFDCGVCASRYQLKAGKSLFKSSVPDGAYDTMLQTVKHPNAPHFLLLTYGLQLRVSALIVV